MRNLKSKIAVLIITLSAVVAVICFAADREGMTKAELIAEIQKNWDEIWVNGNLDAMDEASDLLATSYTADAVIHSLQDPDTDPASLKQGFAWMRSQFSDTRVIVDNVIAEGDEMAIQWTMNFTVKAPTNVMRYTIQDQATGESQSVIFPVPIGTRLSGSGCGVLRLVDGKIAEESGYSDFVVSTLQGAGIAAFMLEWIEEKDLGTEEETDKVFFSSLSQGLNMISVPLKPAVPYTARSLAEELSATVVIKYDEALGRFVGYTPEVPGDGFAIEGGKGYIVNASKAGTFAFTGSAWTNEPTVDAAPPAGQNDDAWAFVVCGSLLNSDIMNVRNGHYTATVKNLRTGVTVAEALDANGYFTAAWADLNRKAVVEAGDGIEIAVANSVGSIVSGPFTYEITPNELGNTLLKVQLKLGEIIPEKTALLQNFPNPFNPETWIPYNLKDANPVSIRIYNSTGQLIRTLDMGYRDAGIYASRDKAAYWDGKNKVGEQVPSGIYFYNITAGEFTATKKMLVKK